MIRVAILAALSAMSTSTLAVAAGHDESSFGTDMIQASTASPSTRSSAGPYIAIGSGFVTSDEEIVEFTSFNLIGVAGYSFNEYFSLEAEGSFVLVEDSIVVGGTTVDVGLTHFGAFARLSLPTDSAISPHIRAGYIRGEATAEAGGASISVDDEEFAYGAGFSLTFSDSSTLRADYTVSEFEGTDASILAVSSVFKF